MKIVVTLSVTIFTVFTLLSCQTTWEKEGYATYTDYTIADINSLEPPVILIGKTVSMGLWGVTVRDNNNAVRTYGNRSTMANHIGETMNPTIIRNGLPITLITSNMPPDLKKDITDMIERYCKDE